MATAGLNPRMHCFVLLMLLIVIAGQNTASNTTGVSAAVNVTATSMTNTTTSLPDTSSPVRGDVTTVTKNAKVINYLKGAVLNLTVNEQPWHEFTIQFDEDLLSSWLKCLNDENTVHCITDTSVVYGSVYVHTANLTSSDKSNNPSKYIFRCALQDQRYIQEKGEIICSRSNLTCIDALDACKLSYNDISAIFLWDASQVADFGHDPEVIQRICGDVCESGEDKDESVEAAVSRVPRFIWIIVGVVGAVLLISLIIIIVILCRMRRHEKKKGSKTLVVEEDQTGKRSSKFVREEDPSDELRLGDTSQVSPIGFVELSELDKSQRKGTSARGDHSEIKEAKSEDEKVEHRSSKNLNVEDGEL